MVKAFLCLSLLAASVMGTAPAFAACLPVNALIFESEPACNVSAAAPRATPAPVAPAAVAAPVPPAAVAAPARQEVRAPAQEKVQPPAPAPAREVVERKPASSLYRVQRNLSDGFLAMRSGPGGQYDMIVRIPAGTDGLSVAECPKASDGSRGWCRVSWKGKTGWVFSRFIAQN